VVLQLGFRTWGLITPQLVTKCNKGFRTWADSLDLRVFENRMLRRIFGPKRDEVTGDWRKLHNEELHNLYSLLNIIRMIKSRRMKCARNVARMGRNGMHIEYWWESQKDREH
jgi:hypothetical protein